MCKLKCKILNWMKRPKLQRIPKLCTRFYYILSRGRGTQSSLALLLFLTLKKPKNLVILQMTNAMCHV